MTYEYLTMGGVGDVLLTLADATRLPVQNVHVTYVPVPVGSRYLSERFLKYFKVPYTVVDDDEYIFQAVTPIHQHRTLLPYKDGKIDYSLWKTDTDSFRDRLIASTNWQSRIPGGHLYNPTVVIAPSGSRRTPGRQRYLTEHELQTIIDVYNSRGNHVLVVGSQSDRAYYHPTRCQWLQDDKLIDSDGFELTIGFQDFLRFIANASTYLSVDTWLKTFVALLGKPVTVFQSRNGVTDLPYGNTLSDYIFLNPDIWPQITLTSTSDFIRKLTRN